MIQYEYDLWFAWMALPMVILETYWFALQIESAYPLHITMPIIVGSGIAGIIILFSGWKKK